MPAHRPPSPRPIPEPRPASEPDDARALADMLASSDDAVGILRVIDTDSDPAPAVPVPRHVIVARAAFGTCVAALLAGLGLIVAFDARGTLELAATVLTGAGLVGVLLLAGVTVNPNHPARRPE